MLKNTPSLLHAPKLTNATSPKCGKLYGYDLPGRIAVGGPLHNALSRIAQVTSREIDWTRLWEVHRCLNSLSQVYEPSMAKLYLVCIWSIERNIDENAVAWRHGKVINADFKVRYHSYHA